MVCRRKRRKRRNHWRLKAGAVYIVVGGECVGKCVGQVYKFCVMGLTLKGRACAARGFAAVRGGWAGFEKLGAAVERE